MCGGLGEGEADTKDLRRMDKGVHFVAGAEGRPGGEGRGEGSAGEDDGDEGDNGESGLTKRISGGCSFTKPPRRSSAKMPPKSLDSYQIRYNTGTPLYATHPSTFFHVVFKASRL